MAKPTDEIITLPSFNSTFVEYVDNEYSVTEQSLASLFASNLYTDTGLIVYFYPKDNTAGCSVQAQDFTAMKADFLQAGYHIIGVSRDSAESHQKFIEQKQLDLPLIADTEEALCQHFDVIKEKNMYGKKVLGLVRSAFVFDKEGTLTHAQRNLRAKGYAERLLTTLNA